jgi:isoleucyl-tRNA synthetase
VYLIFCGLCCPGISLSQQKTVCLSIPCKTALAEAEVEYREHVSPSIRVKFKLTDGALGSLKINGTTHVVIWTTTPWTIPSNLAIAVHPNLNYVILNCGHENYLVSEDRVQDFAQSCRIEPFDVIATFQGSQLEGLQTKHPLVDRRSQVVLAHYLTTDSGTGCVHTAPGHGLEDSLTGIEYKLDIDCPIDDDGQIQGVPPTQKHLRIKGVPRNSAGVETFFTPHTLHPLH